MCKFQLTDKVNIILFEGRFIRQRGEIGGSSVKTGRRIKELERLYGVYLGNHINENLALSDSKSQSDIADKMGISVAKLGEYKRILTLIPELQDMVDDKLFIIKFQQ